MMKLAIMQPYFFPYIGYYQLLGAVDKFVFLDDVAYHRGWMNRNRLCIGNEVRYITVPLSKASQNQPLDQVRIDVSRSWREKMLRSVAQSYGKAPHFEPVFALFRGVLEGRSEILADMAKDSIRSVAAYLNLKTQFVQTSCGYGNTELPAEERILDIIVQEKATVYFNLPGGRSLYSDAAFAARNIALDFIKPNLSSYPRNGGPAQPGLSILDVLMYVSISDVRELLGLAVPENPDNAGIAELESDNFRGAA